MLLHSIALKRQNKDKRLNWGETQGEEDCRVNIMRAMLTRTNA